MTPEAYRDAIARLGLSQVGAGKLFGVTDRTSRRWASGDQDVPRAVEIALDLFIRTGIPPSEYG